MMDTIKAFAAEAATVIVGTVYDEALGDELRVTIVATGLGKPRVRGSKPSRCTVVASKTGTDNQPVEVDYDALEQPAVMRRAQPRRDGRGDAAVGRGDARHPGVPAQAGGLSSSGPSRQRRSGAAAAQASHARARPASVPTALAVAHVIGRATMAFVAQQQCRAC